jgi:hypothetical protein
MSLLRQAGAVFFVTAIFDADVSLGSKAAVATRSAECLLLPDSGGIADIREPLLRANSGTRPEAQSSPLNGNANRVEVAHLAP